MGPPLISGLGKRAVHLIGHEIGASVALHLAIQQPRVVASLTLSNLSELGFAQDDDEFRKAVIDDRIGEQNLKARLARLPSVRTHSAALALPRVERVSDSY